ncbi:hypothetical protein Daus18300_005782 [Diaporthe australafricana]|uniref:Heterokaryon incompatibility domain-containing protein n=1 Tax=Diaporthe australafricana TaxID=127596 RepID=A0ABR3WZS1_9PEZI
MRSLWAELKAFADFQIGLPDLSVAGSAAHFEVVRQWLHECDNKHHHERSAPTDYSTDEDTLLPTRLLDVGISDSADDTIRLWETEPSDTGLYVALSHPWGAPPYFCTYISNLGARLSGISVASLPATFRHAVAATRALGVRHLWIDSVCIVQGPDGDFGAEAKRMERVFRGAYCVLAASCALGQDGGFLKPRRGRDYVPLRSREGEGPFYVCENVDDFDAHALRGHLNSRGWVLQEHALARRTVFFTEHQTYWECGAGVQCETGTRMSNLRAAFLGDTHFPQMILSASKGEHIVRYQNLYAQYSRLGLSRPSDRLYAINGLQTRLLRAFRTTEGGFGLFDEGPVLRGHLRRSLLWRRGEDVERLEPIGFPGTSESPPSWSWMAYTGGIDYLEPVFDKTSWKPLASPWTRPGWADAPTKPLREGGGLTLEGMAERFDLTRARGLDEALLVFDRPEEANSPLLHCVVLGASGGDADGRRYVLVVTPMSEIEGNFATWARVGAGYLTARCLERNQTRIVIC